ncbi:type II toxin-antitoxin system HicB family antitoxin [Hydrogenobaculum acidophilum]
MIESVKSVAKLTITIEKLPEGFYLATSDDIQGLVAQGKTIEETVKIALDVVRHLSELSNKPIDPQNIVYKIAI